jgi:hypothetical protein
VNGQVGIAKLVIGATWGLLLCRCETRRGASTASPAISAPANTASEDGPRDPADAAMHESATRDGAAPASPRPSSGAIRAPRVLRFAWEPPGAPHAAYEMSDPEDQHRIVLPPGASPGVYPVLVAFHGQPRRGEAPRRYSFGERVLEAASRAMDAGDLQPTIVALPVFRYLGVNWPQFDVALFKKELEARLAAAEVRAKGFYVVGHSGAAGCGGDGMNRAHRMEPAAVGFFDTCLGRGWRDEVDRLRAARIPTLLVHSLETAAFVPRQATEYLSTFDFGRAYGPAGLAPIECPAELPRAPLRAGPFRCSADAERITRGFIVDSGEGEEGHNALVPIALEYFLRTYVGPRATR